MRRAVIGALLLALAYQVGASARVDIAGTYGCVGTNPDGSEYETTLTIGERGDTLLFTWRAANGDETYGIGILNGEALSAVYSAGGGNVGLVVYTVTKTELRGRWALAGLDQVMAETCAVGGPPSRA